MLALGDAQDRRTRAEPPALAVLLDQAPALERADAAATRCSSASRLADASSVSATGCSLSSTRTSSSAPRSTAVVPCDRTWNCCSTGVILRPPSVKPRSRRSACSSTPCRATRSSARTRWTCSTAAGDGSSPSSGIEFLLPEAVELLRDAGQIVEDENRVRFDPEFILEQVAKAPREFELQARNPANDGAHRRRQHGVRARLRVSVHPRGRRPPRREDGRLREPRPARAGVPRARLARRHDLRARGPAARLAPPRHGVRAADTVATSRTWAR